MADNDPSRKDAPPIDATLIDTPRSEGAPSTLESDPTIAATGAPVLAGRYELVGLLGSGGMGTVYRARDRELDEIVALKVLKGEVAQAAGMLERFRREVKLARKVTHRNVARTFDIGEHGGDRFLTMEFVEGESLSMLAHRAGRLAPGRVALIAREICEGLAASHEAGVIHGDLKPENVLLAKSGRVVITDFGIARALVPDPNDPRTAAGMICGTPAYMAPEQVEGSPTLDPRADIYALGCMMYRLLTGESPWTGTSFVSIAAARLLREPPDVRTLSPDVPEALATIVLKCMARERDDRYANAREVGAALASQVTTHTEVSRGASSPPKGLVTSSMPPRTGTPKSVAVLPIVNQGVEDDSYLAGGLTDDLIDVLSAVPLLRVRPRGASGRVTGPDRDLREAGRALGVEAVVDGSLRRNGDLLRATLRLVTVEDGFQLWARRFDRPPSAFLSIADEAAADIAGVLASEKVAAARESPTDAMALDLYLRGRYVYTRNYFDVAQAVSLLRAAHERAPRDGRIASSYALALMRQYNVDALPDDVVEVARRLAESVLAKDESIAEAHVALAIVHLGRCEFRESAEALRRAHGVSPTNADVLAWLANTLAEVDRPREALDHYHQALAADANLRLLDGAIARCHALLGEWDAAFDVLTPLATNTPATDPILPWLVRARLTLWEGNSARAKKLIAQLAKDRLPDVANARVLRLLELARDRKLSPEGILHVETELRAIKLHRRTAFNTQVKIEVFMAAGLPDRARALLPSLEESRLLDLTWLRRCPLLAPLRDDPEFSKVERATALRAESVREVLHDATSGLRRASA